MRGVREGGVWVDLLAGGLGEGVGVCFGAGGGVVVGLLLLWAGGRLVGGGLPGDAAHGHGHDLDAADEGGLAAFE